MSKPLAFNPTLPEAVHPEVRKKFRDIASIIDQPLHKPGTDAATESANTRRVTVQMRNRRNEELQGPFIVNMWLSTTREGPPVSLGHTFTIISGEVLETIVAGSHYRIITDADGVIEFDLEIAGPATRYVVARIDGRTEASEALAWA